MISKELLGEVLKHKIWKVIGYDKNTNQLRYCIYPNQGDEPSEYTFPVNIYELAHKCKVWAFSHNYFVKSGIIPFGNSQAIVYLGLQGEVYRVKIDTELEAIFEACQWILENKDKR